MNRRNLIKQLGLIAGASVVPGTADAFNPKTKVLTYDRIDEAFDRPVKVITLGAGSRGNVYGDYRLLFPDQMKIVGVAEPIAERNKRYAEKHAIQDDNRFDTWEHVFERPKFADAVIISTPDQLHYGPCMRALELGYDILLEKPISPSEQECLDILAMAKKTGAIVAVCHVLRYAPYFIELKRLIQSGAIGELISVDHFEPIEHKHMAHSYVRGNWRNSETSTPIIMAKSCHDMDIMRWLIDEPCKSIAAYGSLKWFKKENDPEGSAERCLSGCSIEPECPYSAKSIYYENRERDYVFELPKKAAEQGEYILKQLMLTNYGRCVYKMDNNQPDHYVTSIQFENDITASFSMEAFTGYKGRRTRIMGSMGDIQGDMKTISYSNFKTGKTTTTEVKVPNSIHYKGHGGGDIGIMKDFLLAVAKKDPSLLSSTIDVSIESHLMCFKSEESRLGKKMVSVG